LLRKFYLAAAQRDEFGSLFTLTPIETVGIGVNLNWYQDDFDQTQVGLTERDALTVGVDVSWSPVERLTTHAFYDYEEFESQQIGWGSRTSPSRWTRRASGRAPTGTAGTPSAPASTSTSSRAASGSTRSTSSRSWTASST